MAKSNYLQYRISANGYHLAEMTILTKQINKVKERKTRRPISYFFQWYNASGREWFRTPLRKHTNFGLNVQWTVFLASFHDKNTLEQTQLIGDNFDINMSAWDKSIPAYNTVKWGAQPRVECVLWFSIKFGNPSLFLKWLGMRKNGRVYFHCYLCRQYNSFWMTLMSDFTF